MCGKGDMYVIAHVWKLKYNLGQVLSFYHRIPADPTHAINFGGVMANLYLESTKTPEAGHSCAGCSWVDH